jgi:hypothetical protein
MVSTKTTLTKIVSMACVLHCLVAPFLMVAAPAIGHAFELPVVKLGVFIISIFCGISIIYTGYCTHKKKHSAILFAIGALFWTINALFEAYSLLHMHIELLIIGSIFVAISYKINHKHSKCCTHPHH